MEKRFAVLLGGALANDYRVLKTIDSLLQLGVVDVFCMRGTTQLIPHSKNLQIIELEPKNQVFTKLLRHSLFCFEFHFFIRAVLATKRNYSVIWANDLPMLYPAVKIASRLKAQLVYDSHEIYCETLNQFFPTNPSFFKGIVFHLFLRFMRYHGTVIEKKYLPLCALVFTVNDSISSYFQEVYNLEKKPLVLMNYPRKYTGIITPFSFRKQFNWTENDTLFLYQGNLNQGRGLNLLVTLFCSLPISMKLIIIGNGVLEKELKKIATKSTAKNIVFLDNVSLDTLPTYTAGADVGINLLEPINLSKQLASPNKLYEYLQAGIPVIGSNTTENANVIIPHKIGLLTENTVSDLKTTIEILTREKINNLKINCEKCADLYLWEKQEVTFLMQIKKLLHA